MGIKEPSFIIYVLLLKKSHSLQEMLNALSHLPDIMMWDICHNESILCPLSE